MGKKRKRIYLKALVRHGKWLRPTKLGDRTFNIPHCSSCDYVPCEEGNYCPECGAKMDLEEE